VIRRELLTAVTFIRGEKNAIPTHPHGVEPSLIALDWRNLQRSFPGRNPFAFREFRAHISARGSLR